MIHIGQYNELIILRRAPQGLYLWDGHDEEVLLPNKYCPEEFEFRDVIRVFVYLDHEERKVATTLNPKVTINQFAFLQVSSVEPVGAFLDWGLEKQLLVPFKEQREPLKEGRWYVVYMALDEETNRLYASNRLNRFLQNHTLSVAEGDAINLIVMKKTELGFSVIVNHQHLGLIYHNEIFTDLRIGDTQQGYVKTIREDQKLDISLQPIGYTQFNDTNCTLIYQKLVAHGGRLSLSDKSAPEAIYDALGMSKKAFKRAVGALYKQRKIKIGEGEIVLLPVDQ